ncbi:hypothetical protein [Caenispirillum salinarum]|uniref:hypothetical protein n=1 Tax=Caenispirillum salinarum TaxID=859058 RepID=UPI00384A8C34
MRRLAVILVLALGLGACSTNVAHKMDIPADVKAGVNVAEIKTTSGADVLWGNDDSLAQAVREELAKRPKGEKVINLTLHVTKFAVQDGGLRFFIGALAGANEMMVTVNATDETGAVVANYVVERSANPGGYGAFYDQRAATIRETAKGIVDALLGEDS